MKAQTPPNDTKHQPTQATSKIVKPKTPATKQLFSQQPWFPFVLLILAIFFPFFGELIQLILIGEEEVCCMPDNLNWLTARAGIAQFLRPLSNLIIGGSMIVGIVLACRSALLFYRYTLPRFALPFRVPAMIITILLTAYIITTLVTMLLFFIFRNNLYYYDRPWPDGRLYDGAWYNPIHWWRATFSSPFS